MPPSRLPRASAAPWAQRVFAWQRSGRSAAAFAALHHLDPKQLSWWKWSLARRRPALPSASAFLPVRVVSTALALAPSPAPPPCIEIVLTNGRVVRVRGAVDGAILGSLLLAAEGS